MEENKKIAENHLNVMLGNFEKSDFKERKDVEERAKFITEQVIFVQQLNLINTICINEYLARIEKKRIDELNKLGQKEYREQVVNFNDDYVTDRERRILSEKEEKLFSMSDWKETISDNNGSSSGNSDREDNFKNKENERNESKEY